MGLAPQLSESSGEYSRTLGWAPSSVVCSSFQRPWKCPEVPLAIRESVGPRSSRLSASTAALLLCISYNGFPHLSVGFSSKRVLIAIILTGGRGCLTNHDRFMKQIMLGNLYLLIGGGRLKLVLYLGTKR